MKEISKFSNQRGASVTSIVLAIAAAGVLLKLGFATVPAYLEERQINDEILKQLQQANSTKQNGDKFLNNLSTQLDINGIRNVDVNELITFTNKSTGKLAVKTNYSSETVLYGSTVIANRFSAEINNDGITRVEPTVEDNREKISFQ